MIELLNRLHGIRWRSDKYFELIVDPDGIGRDGEQETTSKLWGKKSARIYGWEIRHQIKPILMS